MHDPRYFYPGTRYYGPNAKERAAKQKSQITENIVKDRLKYASRF